MLLTLCFLCIAAYIANIVVKKVSPNKTGFVPDNWEKYFLFGAGFFFLFFLNPFVHNSAGERTYYQNPIFGGEGVIFEPGYHVVGPFSRTQAWPDVMNTNFDEGDEVRIQFNDGTGAIAQANVRWDLPRAEESMIALHKAYRSPEQLEIRTLEPFARECLSFAAQLMESTGSPFK